MTNFVTKFNCGKTHKYGLSLSGGDFNSILGNYTPVGGELQEDMTFG